MIELGISEAQSRFTKLLSQAVTIIDKKSYKKRAVMLPYDEYLRLLARQKRKNVFESDSELDAFVGVLKGADKLNTEDERYRAILK